MVWPRTGGRSLVRTPPTACSETERYGEIVRYWEVPETGFRRRLVANLVKLLPINSQL